MWKLLSIVSGFWLIHDIFKQNTPDVNPPATVNAATAQLGTPIPVLFGTREIAQPNVTWYGDIATVAVKSSGGKK